MKYDIRIEYRCSANLRADSEDLCQKITGSIIATDLNTEEEEEEEEEEQNIGEIELAYIDVISAQNEGYRLVDLFDADPLPSTYCFTLYDLDSYDWSQRVYQTLGKDIFHYNLLIIHRIKLLPEFRGHRIGLLAIRRSIQQFAHGCGLACLKANPYQIELKEQYGIDSSEFEAYGLGKFPTDASKATRQLEAHYQQAGFTKIHNSDLMAINLDKELPSMEQLAATFDGIFEIDETTRS